MELLILFALAGLVYLFVQERRGRTASPRLPERPRRVPPKSSRTQQLAKPERRRTSEATREFTIRVSAEDLLRDRVPEADADECWVSPGQLATVQGWTIHRGMVYVGRGLRDGRGWRTERALIDPSLRASRGATSPLPYYPSYAELTPTQRGRYLDWLAIGADDPGIGIGYVFLYFYGLERRVFLDGAEGAERAAIVAEVRRLYHLYRASDSFEGYASSFLNAATGGSVEDRVYLDTPELANRWEPDLRLKLALGQAAADGVPIPADWALLWLHQDPKTYLRTAATRCSNELRDLFRQRYRETFGDGLQVKPNQTPLRVSYRAASGNFQAAVPVGDLPDLTALTRPLNRLRPLLDACTDDLDAYSRFVGRHPEKRATREAVGLLPPGLARERLADLDDPFLAWVEETVGNDEPVVVDGGDLIEQWGLPDARLTKSGALRKRDAESVAGVLDLLGVGIEPDVRRGGRKPQKARAVVLFRRDIEEPDEASEAFLAAETVLTLVAAVAHADDDVSEAERQRVLAHVGDGLGLSDGEAARLAACLTHLFHRPPSIRRVEKAAAALPEHSKRTAANLALLTAVADGHLAPAETRVLEKVYSVLGLDPDSIYSDLHALRGDGGEPPVVRRAEGGPRGYALPPKPEDRPKSPKTRAPAFELDMDLVRAKLADTQKASALLAGVFADENGDPPEPVRELEPSASAAAWPGLDPDHGALLSLLVEREEWSRGEVEAAATERGLMAGGALETLNEWAFEHLDDALIEDGDPVVVYLDVWTDYLADA